MFARLASELQLVPSVPFCWGGWETLSYKRSSLALALGSWKVVEVSVALRSSGIAVVVVSEIVVVVVVVFGVEAAAETKTMTEGEAVAVLVDFCEEVEEEEAGTQSFACRLTRRFA